jgi:hypothetical protein
MSPAKSHAESRILASERLGDNGSAGAVIVAKLGGTFV